MFFMSTFWLHKQSSSKLIATENIFSEEDINDKKPSKAPWELVCLPKAEGGLGVLNLQT